MGKSNIILAVKMLLFLSTGIFGWGYGQGFLVTRYGEAWWYLIAVIALTGIWAGLLGYVFNLIDDKWGNDEFPF